MGINIGAWNPVYHGWVISYNDNRPMGSKYVAMRRGSQLVAASRASLRMQIDARNEAERAERMARLKEDCA